MDAARLRSGQQAIPGQNRTFYQCHGPRVRTTQLGHTWTSRVTLGTWHVVTSGGCG